MNPLRLLERDYDGKDLREVWAVLGISNPNPYLHLVSRTHEYKDTSQRTAKFEWRLVDAAAKEQRLVAEISAHTLQPLIVEPAGWLFRRIAVALRSFPIAKHALTQVPKEMWPRMGIMGRGTKIKVLKCARNILLANGVTLDTAWHRIDFDTKERAADALHRTLAVPDTFEDLFYFDWVLRRCKRPPAKKKCAATPEQMGET